MIHIQIIYNININIGGEKYIKIKIELKLNLFPLFIVMYYARSDIYIVSYMTISRHPYDGIYEK